MGFYLQCNDGLGRCMAIFVYIIMLMGNATFFFTVVRRNLGTDDENDRLIEYGCYSLCWLLMFMSHVMTMCVDPGFVPKNYKAYNERILAAPFPTLHAVEAAYRERGVQREEDNEAGNVQKQKNLAYQLLQSGLSLKQVSSMKEKMGQTCKKCNAVKPPRSHHCSTCGRCVLKMDHHCPWMNNCIGLRNQKAFLLFNFYTMCTSAWTTIRVGIATYNCNQDDDCDIFNAGLTIMTIITMIFCVLFTLFCAIMFCDQVSMIMEDTSTIDRMQARRTAEQGSSLATRKSNKVESSGTSNKVAQGRSCCGGRGAKCSPCFWLPCTVFQDNTVEGQLRLV